MRVADVLADAGRPVAYHPGLARALGSIPAALMLAQLLYWHDRTDDGWVWKVEGDWDYELALTPKQLRTARAVLTDLGLVEHKRDGMPARPFYRVDVDALDEWWVSAFSSDKTGQKGRTRPAKRTGQDRPKGPDIPLYRDDNREYDTETPTLLGDSGSLHPVEQVFAAWVEATGKARSVLDAGRRRLITKALGQFPLIDVLDAVRGWQHSAYHRGENDQQTVYNDLGLLLRDASHIERFRDFARRPSQSTRANGHLSASDRAMADPSYWESE